MKLEFYKGSATTSRARTSNVSTIIMSSNHSLITGDTVTISGLGGTGYNDSDVTITVTNSTTFTYTNTGTNEGTTGDTDGLVFPNFTFPYNARLHSVRPNKYVDQRDFPYNFSYFGTTNPLKTRLSFTITGHFSSTNKSTNFRSLAKFGNSNKLMKFYMDPSSPDRFAIVIPNAPERTDTGNRTNFVDYVMLMTSPFGILFDETQQSGVYNGSDSNAGDVFAPIEKITGTTSAGTVTIKDKDGNGITFTSSGGATVIYLIYQTDLGANNLFTEYIYAEVGGTKQVLAVATDGQEMVTGLDPGETLTTRFNSGSSSIAGFSAGPTFFFRNGHSSI